MALRSGSHSIELMETKEQIKANHTLHPDSWYLSATSWIAYRFNDFPLRWVAFHELGVPIMSEQNEVWGVPLLTLNPSKKLHRDWIMD